VAETSIVTSRVAAPVSKKAKRSIMAHARSVPTFALVFVSLFFVGCAHSETATLGSLDLSTRGATCEGLFTWNMHFPVPALILSDADGATRPFGENPKWPLAIQVDVFDLSGKLVATCPVARDKIQFANWYVPKTCLELTTTQCFRELEDGRSYKVRLTVTHEEKRLGTAKVIMTWVVGTP
jgi:hypothetical protein